MAAPDVSTLSSAFVQWGGDVLRKQVSTWDLQKDFFIHRNVTMPQVLPRIAASGNPRPYAAAENLTDPTFTDRTLTVYQSKWDWSADYELLRNTYLASTSSGKLDPYSVPLHQAILEQYSKEYLSQLYDNAIGSGTYNSAGTTAASTCTGLLTLIASLITATTLTAIATGAIASTDAVTKVETFMTGLPAWMKQRGFKVLCSFAIFEKYRTHYRTLNAFGFQRGEQGSYQLDGYNATLEPRGWMGTSSRLIAVPAVSAGDINNPLRFGTNDEAIAIYPTVALNIIKVRMMFPIGLQISDTSAIFVNDQA
jgi:hypothetical protein